METVLNTCANCSPFSRWVILTLLALFLLGAFLSWPKKGKPTENPWIATTFWVLAAIMSLFSAFFITEETSRGIDPLNKFLEEEQVTFLALVVALAAYTSGVQQKLRESMAKLMVEKRREHIANIHWLHKSDVLLVLTGLVLTIRMGRTSFGVPDNCLDRLSVGLIGWVILFFVFIHGRQYLKNSEEDTETTGRAAIICEIAQVLESKGLTGKPAEDLLDKVKGLVA